MFPRRSRKAPPGANVCRPVANPTKSTKHPIPKQLRRRSKPKPLFMKLDDWLEEPENMKLLTEHNEALDKAKAREGDHLDQKGSLTRLSKRLEIHKMEHEYQTYRQGLHVSFTPPMYQPCDAPLSCLKKAMIKDLRCETRSLDFYVLLRVVSRPIQMSAVMAIVADEDENVVLLRILPESISCHQLDLNGHMVFLVKQPFLHWVSRKEYEIRVDHISDIEFISRFDDLVPECWRDESFKDASQWSLDRWLDMGDEDSRQGKYGSVIAGCTKALEHSQSEDDAALILSLRSDGYFQTHQYEAALHDLQQATGEPQLTEHILRRKALVEYRLQAYEKCTETYYQLLKNHTARLSDHYDMQRANTRYAEQEFGIYDFKLMQNNAKRSRTLLLDHATYKEPVTIKPSKIHGRGLFTTRAVKAGDLLLCEKAFSYIFQSPKSWGPLPSGHTVQVNAQTKRVTQGPLVDLTSMTLIKMHKNPSLRSVITDLHNGNTNITPSNDAVDSFLVSQIVSLNSFGTPITSHALHSNATNHNRIMAKFTCLGIWPCASYINHACTSNVRRSFIGDMMIVRAAQDMPPNTELKFWYKVPSKCHPTDTSHWGFQCDCGLCTMARATPDTIQRKRVHLRSQIWRMVQQNRFKDWDFIEEKMEKLQRTYGEGMKFGIWDLHFAVAKLFVRGGEDRKAVVYALRGFEALGFEIEGVLSGEEIVVRRWGVVVDEMVGAWRVVYLAFLYERPAVAAMADRLAKLTYLICVGEDGSFDENYGKRSGAPCGAADVEED